MVKEKHTSIVMEVKNFSLIALYILDYLLMKDNTEISHITLILLNVLATKPVRS